MKNKNIATSQTVNAQLNKDWQIKKLGEVCELSAGGDVPKDNFSEIQTENYKIPIYANGEKNDGLYGYTNISKVVKPSITVSARGTIGFSVKRLEPFFPIVRLIVITPISLNELSLDYLDYAVRKIDFKYSGSSIPQLTVPMIMDYEIPLPPLATQHRIVSILDKAFSAIERSRNNAEQNLKNAKEIFESYLEKCLNHDSNDLCDSLDSKTKKKSSNQDNQKNQGSDKWERKKLGEITTKIGSGATPRGGQESYKIEGISLVRSMNVHDLEFREKNLAFIDEKQAKELDGVTLQEDDVLLNITGASVARCCVIPKEFLPARVNQHVSIIRPKKEILDAQFLNLLLTSKPYKDQLLFTGEQGATRQAITKAQIESFSISFPPLKAQQTIVRQLDALRAETQKLEAVYQQKIANLEELKKSILQKAFSGELCSPEGAEYISEEASPLADKNKNITSPERA